MVFDTWAQIDDGTLAVRWDVELNADETDLLARLVSLLGYLGRAESWVDAELCMDSDPKLAFEVKTGQAGEDMPSVDWEQVSLLAPLSMHGYSEWRRGAVDAAIAAVPVTTAKGKPLGRKALAKKRTEVEATYPLDLVSCLETDTAWLHRLGWSQPPGSRKVMYWRPRHVLESAAPRPHFRKFEPDPVRFMLLSMATATGNDHALPSVARALPQAELLHAALVSRASRRNEHSPVITGCDESGSPLRGPHEHAHLLSLDLDGDGYLDHVLIWAPMGLDARAQDAVRAVRRTFTKGGTAPLRLALAACGSRQEMLSFPGAGGVLLKTVLGGSSGSARKWRSLTPFVAPRYLKKSGRNSLTGQVDAELASRGLPPAEAVVVRDPHTDSMAAAARKHVRVRRRGAAPPVDHGFVLDLTLSTPIQGPLLLGYGSHFGLGAFIAAEE